MIKQSIIVRKGSVILFLISLLVMQSYAQVEVVNTGSQKGFVKNCGQFVHQDGKFADDVLYMYCEKGMKVQLHPNSLSFETFIIKDNTGLMTESGRYKGDEDPDDADNLPFDKYIYKSHRIDIEFIGANSIPEIIAANQSESYYNYYTQYTPMSGIKSVPSYNTVTYKNLYDGIDLVLKTSGEKPVKVTYDFIVHPGASASKIKYVYKGADQQQLYANGSLVSRNDLGQT